ncbi:MAG: hypothetical protein IJC43_08730 [Clostridia bacterium]|nr:hypothetical protein [Clostridia bacterium]
MDNRSFRIHPPPTPEEQEQARQEIRIWLCLGKLALLVYAVCSLLSFVLFASDAYLLRRTEPMIPEGVAREVSRCGRWAVVNVADPVSDEPYQLVIARRTPLPPFVDDWRNGEGLVRIRETEGLLVDGRRLARPHGLFSAVSGQSCLVYRVKRIWEDDPTPTVVFIEVVADGEVLHRRKATLSPLEQSVGLVHLPEDGLLRVTVADTVIEW